MKRNLIAITFLLIIFNSNMIFGLSALGSFEISVHNDNLGTVRKYNISEIEALEPLNITNLEANISLVLTNLEEFLDSIKNLDYEISPPEDLPLDIYSTQVETDVGTPRYKIDIFTKGDLENIELHNRTYLFVETNHTIDDVLFSLLYRYSTNKWEFYYGEEYRLGPTSFYPNSITYFVADDYTQTHLRRIFRFGKSSEEMFLPDLNIVEHVRFCLVHFDEDNEYVYLEIIPPLFVSLVLPILIVFASVLIFLIVLVMIFAYRRGLRVRMPKVNKRSKKET